MYRLLLLTLAAVFASCDSPGGGACTHEYATYYATVLDAQATPVSNAIVDVRRASTGKSILCTQSGQKGCLDMAYWAQYPGGASVGRYLIMDDGISVRGGGERFIVTATRETQRAQADFVFRHGGCHVLRQSGPDTLTLR